MTDDEEPELSLEQHLADRETDAWKDYAENPVDIQVVDDSFIIQPLTQDMIRERMNNRMAALIELEAIELAWREWAAKWKSRKDLEVNQEYDRELLKNE